MHIYFHENRDNSKQIHFWVDESYGFLQIYEFQFWSNFCKFEFTKAFFAQSSACKLRGLRKSLPVGVGACWFKKWCVQWIFTSAWWECIERLLLAKADECFGAITVSRGSELQATSEWIWHWSGRWQRSSSSIRRCWCWLQEAGGICSTYLFCRAHSSPHEHRLRVFAKCVN